MDTIFNGLNDKILEMFTGWLENAVDIFLQFIENVLLNYDGLAGIALNAYNLFVILSGSLLVVICLTRVITMLIGEADGSQEANAWGIILDTIKAGIWLVLTPFIISVTMNIVRILCEYFFADIGTTLNENIQVMVESENFKQAFDGLMSNLLVWLFVLIVVAFFVIKMFIAQANILFDEILSPIIAVSIASDNFDYTENWSRDILSHAVTIVVLVLSFALFVESLSGVTEQGTIWNTLPMMIGSGALVISGPTLVKNLWFTSGAGRTGQAVSRMLIRRLGR